MCAHSLMPRILFSDIRLQQSKTKQGHYAKKSVEVAKVKSSKGRTETVNSHFILIILLIKYLIISTTIQMVPVRTIRFVVNTRELEVL